MRHLRNNVHEKFILSHIIRPYQNDILPGDYRLDRFSPELYSRLTEFAEEDPAWFDKVCLRIAKIYREIDQDVFPFDEFSNMLLGRLKELGVQINPRNYKS